MLLGTSSLVAALLHAVVGDTLLLSSPVRASAASVVVRLIMAALVVALATLLSVPIQAAASVALYRALRVAREGSDLAERIEAIAPGVAPNRN